MLSSSARLILCTEFRVNSVGTAEKESSIGCMQACCRSLFERLASIGTGCTFFPKAASGLFEIGMIECGEVIALRRLSLV